MQDMNGLEHRRSAVTRIVRVGSATAPAWTHEPLTSGQRMERVWELTRLCLAMQGAQADELRLQRSAVRIQRVRR